MQYHREIDGLRAIAVVPVVLYHAGVAGFRGGFTGVDVFFLISGYLITSILTGDLERERFSIVRFYERRARRILPALFLVMLVTLPAAWFLLLPDAFVSFARSVAAVTLFVSNVLFWREEGYFAATAETKPLLHTWSLAVEEQFYLAFPWLLYLTRKWQRRRVAILLLLIGAASFLLWRAVADPLADRQFLSRPDPRVGTDGGRIVRVCDPCAARRRWPRAPPH